MKRKYSFCEIHNTITIWFFLSDNCNCLPVDSCTWSREAIDNTIPKEKNPVKKTEIILHFQKRICNSEKRHMYCCGQKQTPPRNKIPLVEQNLCRYFLQLRFKPFGLTLRERQSSKIRPIPNTVFLQIVVPTSILFWRLWVQPLFKGDNYSKEEIIKFFLFGWCI